MMEACALPPASIIQAPRSPEPDVRRALRPESRLFRVRWALLAGLLRPRALTVLLFPRRSVCWSWADRDACAEEDLPLRAGRAVARATNETAQDFALHSVPSSENRGQMEMAMHTNGIEPRISLKAPSVAPPPDVRANRFANEG